MSALELRDSLTDPQGDARVALRRRTRDRRVLHQVYLHLGGCDLVHVLHVLYTSGPAATGHTVLVSRSTANPYCLLKLWAERPHEVTAEILVDNGGPRLISRVLPLDGWCADPSVVFRDVY